MSDFHHSQMEEVWNFQAGRLNGATAYQADDWEPDNCARAPTLLCNERGTLIKEKFRGETNFVINFKIRRSHNKMWKYARGFSDLLLVVWHLFFNLKFWRIYSLSFKHKGHHHCFHCNYLTEDESLISVEMLTEKRTETEICLVMLGMWKLRKGEEGVKAKWEQNRAEQGGELSCWLEALQRGALSERLAKPCMCLSCLLWCRLSLPR